MFRRSALPVSSASPVVSGIEKPTASLCLDREPIVVKHSSKFGKKSGRRNTDDENEKALVSAVRQFNLE